MCWACGDEHTYEKPINNNHNSMTIKITDEDGTLTIDNEALSNENFIDLTITDEMDNDMCMTVSLDQLQAALLAFEELRERAVEHDERCEATM